MVVDILDGKIVKIHAEQAGVKEKVI